MNKLDHHTIRMVENETMENVVQGLIFLPTFPLFTETKFSLKFFRSESRGRNEADYSKRSERNRSRERDGKDEVKERRSKDHKEKRRSRSKDRRRRSRSKERRRRSRSKERRRSRSRERIR